MVAIWAHRARSRRAQSHKAQSHKVQSRRAWPHRRRHTGREGGRRRRSRASAFTIEVGPTTKLHEHTEDTARAGKRAQGGHVHRWRDMHAQREHAQGAHRPQACARTRTTHCCRVATPSGHAPQRDRARQTQRARATRRSGKHRTGAPRTAAAAPWPAAPAAPRHLFPAWTPAQGAPGQPPPPVARRDVRTAPAVNHVAAVLSGPCAALRVHRSPRFSARPRP